MVKNLFHPIAVAAVICHPSAIDAFHASQRSVINIARESGTALSVTEDATSKPGQYLPTHKRFADHLMQSESFRSSLDNDPDHIDHSSCPHPETDLTSVYDTDLEMQMLKEKKSLNRILSSKEYKSSLDSEEELEEDQMDFMEEMVSQHASLADLMESDHFRHALDVADNPNKPFHATSTATQDEEQQEQSPQEFDLSKSKFNREMLHQKAELNDLMVHESQLHTRQDDFDASLELVVARGALTDVLRSTSFRASLHPNQEDSGEYNGGGLLHATHHHNDAREFVPHSNVADAHLHTLLLGLR